MRTALLAAACVLLVASCQSRERAPQAHATTAPAQKKAQNFGAPLAVASAVPLSQVLANPSQFANRTVTVEGKVRRNCTNRGCWMELAEGLDKALPGCRVTFKDYGFFVPLDSAGSSAKVQGTVFTKSVTASEIAHMEGEGASFSNKQPDGTALEVRIVATGVELSRS
jgi:hypothetical protein